MLSPPPSPSGGLWTRASRLPAAAWVTIYIGLLLNLPIFWRRADALPGSGDPLLQAVAMASEMLLVLSLTGLICAAATLGGRWLWRPLTTLLILASALCFYYMTRFNVVIGYGILSAVFTTDHDMSGEVVGLRLLGWMLVFGLLPLLLVWRLPPPRSLRQLWMRPRRRGLALRIGSIALLALLFQVSQAALGNYGRQVAPDQDQQAPNPVGVAAHAYVPSNWLAGVGMLASHAWEERRERVDLVDPARQFSYRPQTALSDVVLVIVIGETARSDRFGLFGHERPTTPRLATLPNVVGFRALSCDTTTKLSLACMFVRPEGIVAGTGLGPDTVIEDNVFSVLRQLGFDIELFAMQSEVGFYNRVKADFYKFREPIAAQPENAGKPVDDMLLVPELRASLARHAAKGSRRGPLAVVLHTKGSHYLYSQRYPREFARWQPECLSTDADCSRDQYLNAFDNSVLYTDHVLAEIVGTLTARKALLVYASDHGESIDDNSHLHGTPRSLAPPEQRAIPMIFWASDAFLADPVLKAGYARLTDARRDPGVKVGHGNLFATILGCLGLSSPDGGITAGDNLCGRLPASF